MDPLPCRSADGNRVAANDSHWSRVASEDVRSVSGECADKGRGVKRELGVNLNDPVERRVRHITDDQLPRLLPPTTHTPRALSTATKGYGCVDVASIVSSNEASSALHAPRSELRVLSSQFRRSTARHGFLPAVNTS
jgi:hypothetical protein